MPRLPRLYRRERILILAACLLVGLAVATADLLAPDEIVDDGFYSRWVRRRNAHYSGRDMLGDARNKVFLIVVDDDAKSRYGYPLPRKTYGEVVRKLIAAGCGTVAVSVSFENKSPNRADDLAFRETVRDPHVILPYRLDSKDGHLERVLPHQGLTEGLGLDDRLGFSAIPGDGTEVRAVWLKLTQPGHPPHYAFPVVALARSAQLSPEALLQRVRANRHHRLVDRVPVEAVEAWVNIPGEWGGFGNTFLPNLFVSDVLDTPVEQLHRQLGEDSIAVVGEAWPRSGVLGFASGSGDGRKGTLAGRQSGPEIQAGTILNLMLDNFLVVTTRAQRVAYILAAALWAGLLGCLLRQRHFVPVATLSAIGLGIASHQALVVKSLLLPVFSPVLSLLAATAVTGFLKWYFARERRRERILDLVRDVCPPVEVQVASDRTVTVLVADLRDYKFLLEGDAVVGMSALHIYFEAVRRVLAHFGGAVAEYRDNRQVVVFGVGGKPRTTHALIACQAAAALVSEAERLNGRGLGLPFTRIGLAAATPEAEALVIQGRRLNVEVLLSDAVYQTAGPDLPSTPVKQAGDNVRKLNVERLLLQGERPWEPVEGTTDPGQLKVGEAHHHYVLERLLGQGGMGRVFLALDTRLLRRVAIKVVLGYLDEVHCKRFLTEAQAIARVQHPGIVQIYEAEVKPFPYLVMEFVDGRPLEAVLTEKPGIAESLAMIQQVLEALGIIHGNGIVHRDLKPANIMVCHGRTKLMDFGLARMIEKESRVTRPGEIWGTPEYMAPEQLDDEFGEVDAVSDLFAVAAILYEAVAGQRPTKKGSVSMILYDLIYGVPEAPHLVNPEVPEALSAVIMKGLSKQKADRYQSAREFAEALKP